MSAADFRKMSLEELTKKVDETREELMLLRFQAVSGQLTDTSKVTKIKRDIARMETVLTEMRSNVKEEGEA